MSTVENNLPVIPGKPNRSELPDAPAWMAKSRQRQPNLTGVAAVAVSTEKQGLQTSTQVSPAVTGGALRSTKNPLIRWLTSEEMFGVWISLLVNSGILMILAFLVISNVSSTGSLNLFGILSDTEQFGSESILDTTLVSDGSDSVQVEMDSMPPSFDGFGSGADLPELVRFGSGGKGHGGSESGSGDGVSMGGASLKVPGYAQSKGSFSAWTQPRDPQPNENYFIVIQVRLPKNIKKFRGADLTGLVKGTDHYRQEIRFKSSEIFDIEDGVAEIKITVPGGAFRVRDTIQVESKLLREKQTFEIEF